MCAGNSPVFDVFLDMHLNKRVIKQSLGWWFEMPSCSVWRHCNDAVYSLLCFIVVIYQAGLSRFPTTWKFFDCLNLTSKFLARSECVVRPFFVAEVSSQFFLICKMGWVGLWGFFVVGNRQRGNTTTGSALDGAVHDFNEILAYLLHNMSRSQLYLGFGHFGCLYFRSVAFCMVYGWIVFHLLKLPSFFWLTYYCSIGPCFSVRV